ncbi:MAG: DUF2130 domain-containing protein [Tenericutes bacterium]|jgi:hypothetical protein|nr:DUF2130 domain-containing protein [Mycoplasmatota bacterium]
MAKITDIIIINSHTLKLNKDAKKGDEIDLKLLDHIDTSILSAKIDEMKDEEYNRRLKDLRREFELEKENEFQKKMQDKKEELSELKFKIKTQEETIKTNLESQFNLEKERLMHEISQLKREKENVTSNKQNEIELAVQKKVNDIKDEMNQYKHNIEQLKQERAHLLTNKELEKKNAVNEKEKELNEKIKDLENNISKLSLEKSMLNIKKMGEELETWVDQEYQNYALNGFETCTWEKDNESIKLHGESRGTKADYIFKVYATEDKSDLDILTSVACEIKSEDPSSTYKKKNADHFEKLHKDREKKNCEYALLISELEWDSVNDAPIKKVAEYDKMYVVRPQYFVVFLSIVTSLAKVHKKLLREYNLERVKFKDSEDILKEFDSMKDEILNNSLRFIEERMTDINDGVKEIYNQLEKITKASRVVLETHLKTVKNKIEQFSIRKIGNQINDLDS